MERPARGALIRRLRTTKPTPLSTGTVLIVDDYPINRRLTQLLLEKNGFEVRQAGSAAECLAELARELPDMILMDIGLPDIDGLVLTRKIRSDPRMARVIIVAYTGYAMVGDRGLCEVQPQRFRGDALRCGRVGEQV